MNLPSPRTGPIFEIAHDVLAAREEYRSFIGGGSRGEFGVFLDLIAPTLVAAGLPREDVQFAKRYPRSPAGFVRDTLRTLSGKGILPAADYGETQYDSLAARIRDEYDHGPFRTYIYPEEARLLFAIVDILRPQSVLFLGSYYGYWARAPLSVLASYGGRAVLVDPDPKAQEVARRNLASAGLLGAVELSVKTGQDHLRDTSDQYDLVVLDAETPRDHPDPQQRGKAIYGPLLQHALARMTTDAVLVCHNYLFENVTDCEFFDFVIKRNRSEMAGFLNITQREFGGLTECTSTEGVGAGKRRTSARTTYIRETKFVTSQPGRSKAKKEQTMEKGAAKNTEKLSEAISQYKASLVAKITGKVTEDGDKLSVVTKTPSGSPISVEFKRDDVVEVQQRGDGETATVAVKHNADYTVTVAGIAGHEDDLPAGLGSIFDEAGGGRRS